MTAHTSPFGVLGPPSPPRFRRTLPQAQDLCSRRYIPSFLPCAPFHSRTEMDLSSIVRLVPRAWAKVVLPALALLWCLRPRRRRSSLPPPPSPPAHWLLGHALQLPDVTDPRAPHIDVVLLEWARRHGWRVFSFAIPVFGRFVVAADPALVRQALVTENYPKSPTYGHLLPLIGKGSMLVLEGPAWAAQRRAFNPGFSPDFLRGVVATIAEKAAGLCGACAAAAAAGAELGMHAAAVDFTADVIAQVAFGEDWGGRGAGRDAARTRRLMLELQWECTQNQVIPWRAYTNPWAKLRIWRLQRRLDADMAAVVQRRMAALRAEAGQASSRKDILSLALLHALKPPAEARGPAAAAPLAADAVADVVAQLKTFFFAGHDTTSTLISWVVWLLSRHPEARARVRREVARELGPWAEGGYAEAAPPTYEALQRCVYLEAVLQETLRLYPPAGTARYVADPEASFGGYCIGRSIVYVSHYVLHRHPALWDDPDAFRPERFLGPAAAAVDPFAFGPFSRGPRDCIGKYFAMVEGKVAVAALVGAFDFEAVHPEETIAYRVTQRPSHGVRVWVRRRQ